MFSCLKKQKRGASAVEYALLVGLIGAVLLVSLGMIGNDISALLTKVATKISTDAKADENGIILPICASDEVVTSDGAALSCVKAPTVPLPTCGAGEVVTSDGNSLSCIANKDAIQSGVIAFYAGSSCPSGWSVYSAAAGKYIVAAGGSRAVGTSGGADTVTLSVDNLPAHTHTGSVTLAGATFQASSDSGNAVAPSNGSYLSRVAGPASLIYGSVASDPLVSLNAGTMTGTLSGLSSVGGGQAFKVEPAYMALNPCIKD